MKTIVLILVAIFTAHIVSAQHEHHGTKPASDTTKTQKAPATKKPTSTKRPKLVTAKKTPSKVTQTISHEDSVKHGGHEGMNMIPMPSHAFSRNLPMSRNGSGTAWNPDASPMYMWMTQKNKTDWMFHGNVFMRYTHTDIFKNGNRGQGKFSFPNWFMAMMNHRVKEKGLLNITAMLSLDRITEGGDGYPLLFQSGETYQGQRLVDKQHPHDFFQR